MCSSDLYVVLADADPTHAAEIAAAARMVNGGQSCIAGKRFIVLPQVVVRMLPAFGSILSITIKDTAIAAVIAVPEYMNRSQTVAGQSFHPIEVFTVAMAVYFLILFPVTRVVDMVYVRLAHLGRS